MHSRSDYHGTNRTRNRRQRTRSFLQSLSIDLVYKLCHHSARSALSGILEFLSLVFVLSTYFELEILGFNIESALEREGP